MSDPKQTPLRQYEALKTLEGIMPEIRAAVMKAERPMPVNGSAPEDAGVPIQKQVEIDMDQHSPNFGKPVIR